MTRARFSVVHAGPQVTVQDAGRAGLMRYGVPASGPMDRLAFAAANLTLGNQAGAPAIEVSLGGLVLRCTEGPITFAVAGGDFRVKIDTSAVSAWGVATLQAGQMLTIRPGRWGSWCYLAFAGKLVCQPWLGSVSTHDPSGLGGGRLITGDSVTLEDCRDRGNLHAAIPFPVSARPRHSVRVVLGPQDRFFSPDTIARLLSGRFALTDAYDRMGVRLSGPLLHPDAPLDMPSEAIARGSIQVAGDGVATVLLADHQTTGGYPKIATILSDDIDGFVQLRSRNSVTFEAITPQAAVAAARTRGRSRAAYLARLIADA